MKNYNIFNKKRFYLFILFMLLLITFIPIFIQLILIPKEINLIAGNEHKFNFNIPVVATITSQEDNILNINNEEVTQKTNIKLNQDLSITSNEEGEHNMKLSLMGIPVGNVKLTVLPNTTLIPAGDSIGVRINTKGVMVLGTGSVRSQDDKSYEPAKGVLKPGDTIVKAEGVEIQNKEQLIEIIESLSGQQINLDIERNSESQQVKIDVIKGEDGKNKIGVWVRDSTQGIGTLTYYNPKTQGFGALGHGIVDVDTKEIMPVKDGSIMSSEVIDIKKSEKGSPGELVGNIDTENIVGNITLNTEVGIYGKIKDENYLNNHTELPIGLKDQVEIGEATILCNIDGKEIKEYSINIESINKYNYESSKSMVIRITDEELLKNTNGIVQGMSGSPILQNGKIIGAVTHVFIQEPDKGYGIFIENMLKQELSQN